MTSKSFAAAVLFSVLAAACASAQSVLDKLSPQTRAEIEKLSPSERAQLASGTADSDDDFLCTRWGCVGGVLSAGVDDFQNVSQGDYPSETGLTAGFSAAAPVPGLQDYGVGVQTSVSYGQYAWNGRDSLAPYDSFGRQELYSVGLFRRPNPFGATPLERWGIGGAFDTSANRSMGSRADTYTLSQYRFKTSYDFSASHEIGLWGALRDNTASVLGTAPNYSNKQTVNSYRGVDQLNFFYKYSLSEGGSLTAYAGPGVGGSIINPHLPGNYYSNLIGLHGHVYRATGGLSAVIPFSDRLALFSDASYGMPDAAPLRSPQASATAGFSLSTGLRWYWGRNARAHDDTGKRWMPYLSAPNNGSFLTQSNFVD